MNAPKIPSSLKWLINRKARLVGELERRRKLENERGIAAQHAIEALRSSLNRALEREAGQQRLHAMTEQQLEHEVLAADMLIRSHEAGIDPGIIRPQRSQQNLAPYDFGLMTRCIYRRLGMTPDTPCTAADAVSLMIDTLGKHLTPDEFSDLRYRVRQRMKHLAWEGKLVRVKNQAGSLEGRWLISPEILKSPHGTHPDGDDLASNPATTATNRP